MCPETDGLASVVALEHESGPAIALGTQQLSDFAAVLLSQHLSGLAIACTVCSWGAPCARHSCQASVSTCQAECRNSAAMARPTTTSGHNVPVVADSTGATIQERQSKRQKSRP